MNLRGSHPGGGLQRKEIGGVESVLPSTVCRPSFTILLCFRLGASACLRHWEGPGEDTVTRHHSMIKVTSITGDLISHTTFPCPPHERYFSEIAPPSFFRRTSPAPSTRRGSRAFAKDRLGPRDKSDTGYASLC